jgi:fructose-bisphosphate aldolase / 2-amino-3,7-dideoxy-D-threo-hept-6-ulosonate synthase
MPGKALRMQRIINPKTQKTLIIPIDHGAGEGPMPGLEDMGSIISDVSEGGANAIIGHMGMGIQSAKFKKPETAFIYHLSVSTRVNPMDKNDKVLVNGVERALSMGADGASVHINVGSKNESSQLKDLGMVAAECQKYGLPLLAMMYPRGEGLTDDPKSEDMVKLAARIGAELGADIIKTYYTGNKESFARVCASVPVPVVIAGGGKSSDKEAFTIVRDVIDAGGAGVTFGRKVFQHEKRVQFIKALGALIHEGVSVKEALAIME